MPLECTVICLDDSEFMRNGDYAPNRLDSQQDAAALLCAQRINDNAESTVGVMSMASSNNKNCEVLVAPCQEQEKIMAGFAGLLPGGKIDFSTSVQIAQLALKHRKNKTGGQRIIVFVGSPINDESKALTKIGKQLAKNNIAVSVVMLGELDENEEKMRGFVEQANKADNSHLVMVPPGGYLSDALRNSPIMNLGGDMNFGGDIGSSAPGGEGGGSGGGAFEEYGGIDPALDPELAMVMRQSILDARRAEEARSKAENDVAGSGSGSGEGVSGESGESGGVIVPPVVTTTNTSDGSVTDEQALELAARLSLESPANSVSGNTSGGGGSDDRIEVPDEDDEEAALAMAIAMSMSEGSTNTTTTPPAPPTTTTTGGGDATQATAAELLQGIGLDASDPLLAAALAQLPPAPDGSGSGEPPEKKSKKDDDKK